MGFRLSSCSCFHLNLWYLSLCCLYLPLSGQQLFELKDMAPGNKLDLDPKWTMTMDLDLLVYVGFVTRLPLNVMGQLKLSIGMDLTDCWDELSRVSAAYTIFAVAPPSSDRDSYVAAVPGADVRPLFMLIRLVPDISMWAGSYTQSSPAQSNYHYIHD